MFTILPTTGPIDNESILRIQKRVKETFTDCRLFLEIIEKPWYSGINFFQICNSGVGHFAILARGRSAYVTGAVFDALKGDECFSTNRGDGLFRFRNDTDLIRFLDKINKWHVDGGKWLSEEGRKRRDARL